MLLVERAFSSPEPGELLGLELGPPRSFLEAPAALPGRPLLLCAPEGYDWNASASHDLRLLERGVVEHEGRPTELFFVEPAPRANGHARWLTVLLVVATLIPLVPPL